MALKFPNLDSFYKESFAFSDEFRQVIDTPERLDFSGDKAGVRSLNSSHGFGNIQPAYVSSFYFSNSYEKVSISISEVVLNIWEQLAGGNELFVSNGRMNVFLCANKCGENVPCFISFLAGKWCFGLVGRSVNDWVSVGRVIFV